jgi:hypothetical protein
MLKKLIGITLCLVAILAGAAGTIILTVRDRAVDPQTYKLALAPSGVYKDIRTYLETLLIKQVSGEDANLANPLTAAVLAKINLPEVVIKTGETNIDNFFDWVAKKQPEFYIYFPRSDLKTRFSDPELQSSILGQLDIIIPKLPDCTDASSQAVLLQQCKTTDPVADKTRIGSTLKQFFSKLATADNFMDELTASAGFKNLSEKTSVTVLMSDQSSDVKMQNEIVLQTIQDLASSSALLGFLLIVVSLLFTVIDIFINHLHWRTVLAKVSLIYLLSGILITVVGLIGTYEPQFFLQAIPGEQTNLFTSSFSDSAMLFYNNLARILFQITLFTGIVVTLISGLLQAIAMLMPKTSEERRKFQKIGDDLPVDNTLAPGLGVAAPTTTGSVYSKL